jgi:hypothetical protein
MDGARAEKGGIRPSIVLSNDLSENLSRPCFFLSLVSRQQKLLLLLGVLLIKNAQDRKSGGIQHIRSISAGLVEDTRYRRPH